MRAARARPASRIRSPASRKVRAAVSAPWSRSIGSGACSVAAAGWRRGCRRSGSPSPPTVPAAGRRPSSPTGGAMRSARWPFWRSGARLEDEPKAAGRRRALRPVYPQQGGGESEGIPLLSLPSFRGRWALSPLSPPPRRLLSRLRGPGRDRGREHGDGVRSAGIPGNSFPGPGVWPVVRRPPSRAPVSLPDR